MPWKILPVQFICIKNLAMINSFSYKKSEELVSSSGIHIKTIDMHTGGEPLRVVVEGYPEIKGRNVLEKRTYCKEQLDHLRKFLMYEPRGHADMYGSLIVEPNDAEAHFGIIFMHNEGYSTMCGHATIAIAKLAVQLEWVNKEEGETEVRIDAPCGRLTAFVDNELKVRFHNVPSFVLHKNASLSFSPYGNLEFDIAYGGAFYGFFKADDFDLEVIPSNVNKFIEITSRLKKEINNNLEIDHPFEKDLSFLYGCIFIDESQHSGVHSRNICVFAEGEVDRCPTGSGVSARIAIHMEKDEVLLDQSITIESITGSRFAVKAIKAVDYGGYSAYIPEVSGEAFVTGRHEFIVEEGDLIKEGFLLR